MSEETAEPTVDNVSFENVDYTTLPAEQWDAESAKAWREKMAAEHKKYRERWSPYEQTFNEFPEQDRQLLLQAIASLRTNPEQAFAFWINNAKALYGEDFLMNFLESASNKPEQKVEEPQPSQITMDQVQELVSKAVREVEERQRIVRELRDLGLQENSEDAELVCFVAARKFDGDLRKAYDHLLSRLAPPAEESAEQAAAPPAPVNGTPATNPVRDLPQKDRINAIADRLFNAALSTE